MSLDEGASSADDQIRVGHADREHITDLLQQSVSGGYLTIDEFEQRVTQVQEAITRGELRAVIADLPAAEQSRLAPRAVPPAGGGAGTTAAIPETLEGDVWATVRRQGVWIAPPALQLVGSMATFELDFSDSQNPPQGIDVYVVASWSTVRIWVPASMPVDTTGLDVPKSGKLKDKAGDAQAPYGPSLRLLGKPAWTTVILRRRD